MATLRTKEIEADGTGSTYCLVMGFGISTVEYFRFLLTLDNETGTTAYYRLESNDRIL
jgi:hypothetical protein